MRYTRTKTAKKTIERHFKSSKISFETLVIQTVVLYLTYFFGKKLFFLPFLEKFDLPLLLSTEHTGTNALQKSSTNDKLLIEASMVIFNQDFYNWVTVTIQKILHFAVFVKCELSDAGNGTEFITIQNFLQMKICPSAISWMNSNRWLSIVLVFLRKNSIIFATFEC